MHLAVRYEVVFVLVVFLKMEKKNINIEREKVLNNNEIT